MSSKQNADSLTPEARQLILNTLGTYKDPTFAEMYFEKWRNDLPGKELEAFSRIVGIEGKVLDAGCGPGHHANHLHSLGHKTTGIDLSDAALSIARANFKGPEFLNANMLDTPFAAGEFDGIWACAAVMHLPQALLETQLLEYHRLLTTGGVMALTVTVDYESHVDAYGRYFQSYSSGYLLDRIERVGFETEAADERLRDKNTEHNGRSARWITITARKR